MASQHEGQRHVPHVPAARRASSPRDASEERDRELARVLQLVRAQEYRRAMQRLTSSGLADGAPADLAQALQEKFYRGAFPGCDAEGVGA